MPSIDKSGLRNQRRISCEPRWVVQVFNNPEFDVYLAHEMAIDNRERERVALISPNNVSASGWAFLPNAWVSASSKIDRDLIHKQ